MIFFNTRYVPSTPPSFVIFSSSARGESSASCNSTPSNDHVPELRYAQFALPVFFVGTPATAAQIDAFNAYIDNDRYLSGHRGEIADRNGARSPWANTLDLGIQQELPGFAKGHHFVVRMDVNNLLNLLNKDWGQVETVNTFNPRRNLAYVSGFTADGKYKYDLSKTPQPLTTWYTSGGQLAPSRVASLWSALLTLKYEF